MGKSKVPEKGRRNHKALHGKDERSDDESDDTRQDRYQVVQQEHTASYEDSSDGLESMATSESSETEDYSSAVGSYETQSYDSSICELDELAETGSFESKRSVGGWFDFACGWMDRPYMCAAIGGDVKQNSLLRESNMKPSHALRKVKMNQAFSLAATKAAEKEAKEHAAQLKLEKKPLAGASITSVTKEEVQRQSNTSVGSPVSELPVSGQKKSSKGMSTKPQKHVPETSVSNATKPKSREPSPVQKRSPSRKPPKRDSPKRSEVAPDDEIQAKMDAVSASAVAFMKNAAEARAASVPVKKTEDHRKPPSPSSQKEVRQQVERKVISVSTKDIGKEKLTKASPPEVVTVDKKSTPKELKEVDNTKAAKQDYSEPKEAGSVPALEAVPSVQIESENVPKKEIHEVSNFQEATDSKEKNDESPTKPEIPKSEITDLTHIDVDNDGLPSPPSLVYSRSHSPTKRARLAAMKKSSLGKRDVEVIEVLELDDDSWTPGERRDPTPSKSRRGEKHSQHDRTKGNSAVDVFCRDISPSISASRSMLFSGSREPSSHPEHEVIKLWEEDEKAPKETLTQTTTKSHNDGESFGSQLANEAFAGLRRGRLSSQEIQNRTKPKTVKSDEVLDDESIVSVEKAGTKSDLRQQIDTVAVGMGLDKSNNRDVPQPEVNLSLRRRSVTPNAELKKADSRSLRSKNLVDVRSVDEAQRMRKDRIRHQRDIVLHPSKKYEPLVEPVPHQVMRNERDYSLYRGNQSGSMDPARELTVERDTVVAGLSSNSRSHHQRRPQVERRSSMGREQGAYDNVVVSRSKSGNEQSYSGKYEYPGEGHRGLESSNSLKLDNEDHDARDDFESPYNATKRDPAGHAPTNLYSDSRSKRRERSGHEESEHVRELRKLEKKISKQLKQVKQEQGHQSPGWDERSAVSSKNLRKLEKRLVQSLKKEDEKRVEKLKRIRNKKSSRRTSSTAEGNTHDDSQPTMDGAVEHDYDHRSPSPHMSQGMDSGDKQSKYEQLKMLRHSRPMHKYMQRSTRVGTRHATPTDAY
eukprot:Nitzschia sp. Nitz4//scaffold52_size167869//83407//86586//NITZ4_002278-RA/size167869-snap-gene-0.225-mRNA-1//-1//CDS//3329554041//5701//frame0